jgi:hypothetical protein
MRITHDENGFGYDDVTKFLQKGGFWWLPKFLQGSTAVDESLTESAWIVYLRNTLKKCQNALLVLHGCVLLIVATAFFISANRKSNDNTRRRPFLRLLAIHFVWWLGLWSLHQRVQSTAWARNISRGLANHVPKHLSQALDTATTLPTVTDIMKFDTMQSSYMWSFVRVLDVAHPGNAAFYETTKHFSTGYSGLTNPLQRQLRIDVNRALDGRRVLAQTVSSGWAELSRDDRDLFLHESMLRHIAQWPLLQELSFLLSESRFGFHRGTAMHKTHIPNLLRSTKLDLLTGKQSHTKPAYSSEHLRCEHSPSVKGIVGGRNLFKRAGVGSIHGLINVKLDFETSPTPDTTFLSVGDPVEAIFGRDFDCTFMVPS